VTLEHPSKTNNLHCTGIFPNLGCNDQ